MAFDASRFRFIADALNASGGFAPQQAAAKQAADFALGNTYLVQYPRERADKFNRRNQVAVYRNFLLSACSRFNGFLFSKNASRNASQSLYAAMLDDIDQKGNSAEVFWHNFALNAKARGSMLLLVDMPAELPGNLADQVQQRALPYFVAIAPERIADAELNDQNAFDWVAFEIQHHEKKAWKVWTKTDWRIQEPERDGKIHLSAEHPLGICPVLIFTEAGDFPYYGEFSQIADLSLSWFNQVSSRDEILRGNAFPVLTYQIGDTEQPDAIKDNLTIGVSNAILYRGERPDYVSPESTSLDVHERAIDKLEAAIQEIGYHIDLTAQAEAAAALNLRFRNLSSALTVMASRLADFERRCWWVATKWLGRSDTPDIEWPSSYDIADVGGELAILQQMQLSGFAPEVIAEQQKRIIRIQFNALEEVELSQLLISPAFEEHGITIDHPPSEAVQVDLSPIESRLESIELSIGNLQKHPSPQPVIHVTLPEQAPAVVTVEAPQITVEAPQITVEAPHVTVEPAQVNVTLPEQTAQTPQPITVNTGSGPKVIDVVRDKNGAITRANVREA